MNEVYILQSQRNGRYYIGSTSDFERRFKEHQAGRTKSLANLLPIKLVFRQSFPTLLQVRREELRLKKYKSRAIIERIIADGVIKSKGP